MNTQKQFEEFLEKYVNLNATRVARIKEADRVLTDFISNSDAFGDIFITSEPQGSQRQKTIIKPIGEDGAFDVDLLIIVKEKPGWSPKDYILNLAKTFKDSGRYEDITDTNGKTRCVTIDYEGDFHVDLVPAIERNGQYYICNKQTDKFELTDGDGYAQWFDYQDSYSNGYLIPVVRLVKYLRDHKQDFYTKSIILTTLAGMQIESGSRYVDIPHTLEAVLSGMNKYLSQFTIPPSIHNPAMPGETFDRHWKNDQKAFDKLKAAIQNYSRIAKDAIQALDNDEALKHWRKLFGEDFGSETDSSISQIGIASSASSRSKNVFHPQRPWSEL